MTYDARVVEIMIASPSDVGPEREMVRTVIADWNVVNARERKVVLLPIGWETHSAPDLGGRPQQLINDSVLANCDVLVGIFWTRIGSPTGKAKSGTIEEIDEHRKTGKPVMLYFSNARVPPGSIDEAQYSQLRSFKEWAKTLGLIDSFDSHSEFREKFRQQLPLLLRGKRFLTRALEAQATSIVSKPELSEDALLVLRAAAVSNGGSANIRDHLGGTTIHAGDQQLPSDNRRAVARWRAAIEELVDARLLQDPTGRGDHFQVTNAGYQEAAED